jgi:hypothetical protein
VGGGLTPFKTELGRCKWAHAVFTVVKITDINLTLLLKCMDFIIFAKKFPEKE